MPLTFINNASIDRKARKLIRSHVAKGRNVGKKHPCRRKQHSLEEMKAITVADSLESVRNSGNHEIEEEIPTIERQSGDGLSVISFPSELNSTSKSLAQKVFSFLNGPIYPPDLCKLLGSYRVNPTFVQLMFIDEAFFHCTIAMSVVAMATIDSRCIMPAESIEAMRHLSKAFRLINMKLAGSEALSDVTMAVVVGMAQYEILRHQFRKGQVHLEGLQRMIELRGGLLQLIIDKPSIAQKIFRADLQIALYLGSPTRFNVDYMPGYDAMIWIRQKFEIDHAHQDCDPFLLKQLNTELQDILIDIMSVSWILNGNHGLGEKLDGYIFHNILLVSGYRLIRINPLGNPRLFHDLENAIHLGLVAFVLTFMHGIDRKIPSIPLHSMLLFSTAQANFDVIECQEALLWALFIGKASTTGEQDEMAWMVPKIREIALLLKLDTWEAVSSRLSKFPWVTALHDKPARALWRRSRTHSDNAECFQQEVHV